VFTENIFSWVHTFYYLSYVYELYKNQKATKRKQSGEKRWLFEIHQQLQVYSGVLAAPFNMMAYGFNHRDDAAACLPLYLCMQPAALQISALAAFAPFEKPRVNGPAHQGNRLLFIFFRVKPHLSFLISSMLFFLIPFSGVLLYKVMILLP
jgi:hypothetical protein